MIMENLQEDLEQDSTSKELKFTVSELLHASREHLRQLWHKNVWVDGELTNVNQYPSGHTYMVLKDDKAEVSCVMFASMARQQPWLPTNGTSVSVLVEPTIYTAKGKFQLIVQEIKAQGQGKQYEKFLALKEKLKRQGWFDPTTKRPIPFLPSVVGVVVSLEGAVWRDIRTTLTQRFPGVLVRVFPAPAQGANAAAKIAAAIKSATQHGCEVLLVCRGGGSFEDLMAYNELIVAEAIRAAPIPVITGIGHETDESIADYVADLRTATPTAAAVAVVPARQELIQRCNQLEHRWYAAVEQLINDYRQRLDDATGNLGHQAHQLVTAANWRLESNLSDLRNVTQEQVQLARSRLREARNLMRQALLMLLGVRGSLATLIKRLAAAVKASNQARYAALATCQARLQALSPRRTLERGYVMVTTPTGEVTSRASQLNHRQQAMLVFIDGTWRVAVDQPVNQGSELLRNLP